MGDVVYVSKVTIDRPGGPVRYAHVPAEDDPVVFGIHGAIAEHYGASPETNEPHATTLDYVVAAAGG